MILHILIILVGMIYIAATIFPQSNAIQNIALGILLLATIILILRKQLTLKIPIYLSIGYGLWIIGLLIVSLWHGIGSTFNKTLSYISWTLPFFAIYGAVIISRCKQWVIPALSIGTIIMCLYGIYDPGNINYPPRIDSIFPSPNMLALMIIQVIPFLFVTVIEKPSLQTVMTQLLALGTLGLATYTLLLTDSRGAYAGIAVGTGIALAIYLIRICHPLWGKLTILSCTILTLFCSSQYMISHPDIWSRAYDQERVLLVQSSYHMWQDHKLAGIGIDQWQKQYVTHYMSPKAQEPKLPHPHNVFIFFLSTTGTIGLSTFVVCLLMIYIALYQKYNGNYSKYSIAMMWTISNALVHGLFDLSIGDRFALHAFSLLLGITFALTHQPSDTTTAKPLTEI